METIHKSLAIFASVLILNFLFYIPTPVSANIIKKVSPEEGSINIISPKEGSVFEVGDMVTFKVVPGRKEKFDLVVVNFVGNNFFGNKKYDEDYNPPFEMSFLLDKYVGPITAMVAGSDNNEKGVYTEIHFMVKTSSPVEKIITRPGIVDDINIITLTQFSNEYKLEMGRVYKNGAMEDITLSPDTKYRTTSFFKSKVITVSPTGLVKAIGNGTETVIIENGGFETSILFTVNDKNFPPAKPDSPIKDGLYIIIPILIAMITIAVYVGKKVFRFLWSFGSK